MKNKIKILAFRTDRIGDLINTSPFLKSLKNYYNNSEIHLVSSSYNSGVALRYNFIDKVHIYNKKQNLFKQFIFYLKLIFNNYDLCIALDGKRISKIVSILTRAKKKYIISFKKKRNFLGISFNLYRPSLIVCKLFYDSYLICDEDYDNKVANSEFNNHYLTMYYSLLKKNNIKLIPEKHYYNINKSFLNSYKSFFDNNINNDFLNIHIDYKWDNYNLNIDDFVQMLSKISSNNKITITSGFEGSLFFNNLKKYYSLFHFANDNTFKQIHKKSSKILLIENIPLDMIACFIKNCMVSISAHSGAIVHISAAFNTPIIDFIKKSKANEYDRWIPPDTSYKRAFVEKLQNLENEIKKNFIKF